MKRVALLFAILLGVMFLFSNVVSMSEAKVAAENCFLERTGVKERVVSIESIGDRAEPSYYFCYLPNGFAIVAGESRVRPILGFSEGHHQGKDIPPQLQRLLRQFKEEIEYARNQSIEQNYQINQMWEHYLSENFVPNVMLRNVAALLTTTWDQNQYYNNQCPVDASGPGGHAYAGCAAIAMGQVMKYHDYPENGVGSHSYTHATYGTLSANFGTTSYNWTNMPNMLSGISNSTQIAAVAELLYHCGVSMEMDYGPGASGAWIGHDTDPNAADALVNYFDYKSSLQFVEKAYYSDANWHTLLQTDLDNGLPILYAGWDEPTEGHAWVCDGYNSSNEYHMNWGWSGYYNGYYALTSLQPEASMPNFINWQQAVVGIEPNSSDLGTASNPSPSDGATDVSVDTMINWINGANTEEVDVYFSSNQTLVTNKDASVQIYSGTAITGTDPSGVFSLANDTTFYWRVICRNSAKAETDGPVWSFTTEGTGTVEATLSYYPDITYYMPVPDGNGIFKFGVYYTPADECDLTKIKAFFYGIAGNPVSCDIKVYDALDDGTGTEYPNNLLHTENVPIASIVSGWSEPEFTLSTPIHFNAGENFFIIYEIVGTNPTDVVHLLRSNGSTDGVEGSHSICEYSGAWYYHTNLWGTPFEVAMEATVEYAATIPPNLAVTPNPVSFGQTAIGGWKTQNVMMKNIGGGQLVVSAPVFVGDPSIQLYDNNTYPVTLTSGQSVSVMIAYGPDAVGQNSATLTITDDTSKATHQVLISGEGYYHDSWASTGSAFDQPSMGEQGDYSWSMSTSDAAPDYLLAENFWGITEPIRALEFWGINWYHDGSSWQQSDVEDPMTFEINFYAPHATDYEPGTLIESFSLPLTRVEATQALFSGGPVYCYRFVLPVEVPLMEGWISIQGISVSSPVDPWFLWSQSPIGDLGNVSYDSGTSTWSFNDVDLAFSLFTELPIPPMDVTIVTDALNTTVTWTSEAGKNYGIYSDTNPYGTFSTFEGAITDGTGLYTEPTSLPMKFYRVTTITHEVGGRIEPMLSLPQKKMIKEFDSQMIIQQNLEMLKK